MNFCTSIHCMDGRIQEPIANYLKLNYGVKFVDTITELGPCGILAENKDKGVVHSIVKRVNISIEKHGSKLIVISGHSDCAGNPVLDDKQKSQIKESIKYLRATYPLVKVIGLWIDLEKPGEIEIVSN